MKILDNMSVVDLDFYIWSGRRKLNEDDVGVKKVDSKVIHLGNKAIIDPETLKPFMKLRNDARALCLRLGMSFLNGFAIPNTKIDSLSEDLDSVVYSMEQLKSEFLTNYRHNCEQWVKKNPSLADVIEAAQLSKENVEKRLGFDYTIVKVRGANETHTSKLGVKVSGMAQSLLSEVNFEATKFFQANFTKGKNVVPVKTRDALELLRQKVDGLAFLDARFGFVVSLIDTAIKSYKGFSKEVSGDKYFVILSAIVVLMDPDRVTEYAAGGVQLDSIAQSFSAGTVPSFLTKPSNPLPSDDEIEKYFIKNFSNRSNERQPVLF